MNDDNISCKLISKVLMGHESSLIGMCMCPIIIILHSPANLWLVAMCIQVTLQMTKFLPEWLLQMFSMVIHPLLTRVYLLILVLPLPLVVAMAY